LRRSEVLAAPRSPMRTASPTVLVTVRGELVRSTGQR